MRLEDEGPSLKAVPGGIGGEGAGGRGGGDSAGGGGRRMTVVAIDGAAVRRMTAASLALPSTIEEDAAMSKEGEMEKGNRETDRARAATWEKREEEKERARMNGHDEDEKEATLAGSDDDDEQEDDVEQETLMPRIPPPAVARELRLSVAGDLIVEERRGG